MKSDMSRRYRTRVVTNALYSAVISCLVEISLVTNVSMIARYMEESGHMNRLLQAVLDYHVAVALVYVVSGLVLFTVTFMILQEPYIRYISSISDAIQSVSEGNPDTTIDVIGDDGFPSMVADLSKMVEDVRELMDKEREPERTKNELITNVAHDLRTPLISIIGYLELLAGNSKIPAQMQHKYIETAYGKVRRLEKLIEGLSGFTKLNYGRIFMHVSQLDMVKLLGWLLEEAYPSLVEKNLSYDLQSNVPVKIITADGNLLVRLFDNLIGNAIKYGADGKRVLVKILTQEDVVTVSITNCGYAIPPEELPLIFNKFYRVGQSRSSGTEGTGLGLAVAKKIVDMHGGAVNVTSDSDGIMFTVRLQVSFDISKENFGIISWLERRTQDEEV